MNESADVQASCRALDAAPGLLRRTFRQKQKQIKDHSRKSFSSGKRLRIRDIIQDTTRAF